MKHKFLILALLFQVELFAQAPFKMELISNPDVPGPSVHSGAYAVYGGKWIFIGGRTNGLHGFDVAESFPPDGANTAIGMVDPVSRQVWYREMTELSDSIKEPLGSSNMQFYQDGQNLIMIGGYGYSSVFRNYITFPTVTVINLPGLITAVRDTTPLNPHFRQISDSRVRVCGAHLQKLDSTYYLVFGHSFDGRYTRSDSAGVYIQRYSNEIKRFQLDLNASIPRLYNYRAEYDSLNFHRRDYNLVPQIFPDGSAGFTAFSGVFQYHLVAPYFNHIDIHAGSHVVNDTFQQYLNLYHCSNLPVYDPLHNEMHTIFFGGNGLYYWDSTRNSLRVNYMIPFVKTISRVTRSGDGSIHEFFMPLSMPYLLGTNAYFIPADTSLFLQNSILDLSRIHGRTLAGYVCGGIRSPQPDISDADPFVSRANNITMEVWINDDTTTSLKDLAISGPISVQISPNPVHNTAHVIIKGKADGVLTLDIFNPEGKMVQTLYQGRLDDAEIMLSLKTNNWTSGVYYYKAYTANFECTGKFVVVR